MIIKDKSKFVECFLHSIIFMISYNISVSKIKFTVLNEIVLSFNLRIKCHPLVRYLIFKR